MLILDHKYYHLLIHYLYIYPTCHICDIGLSVFKNIYNIKLSQSINHNTIIDIPHYKISYQFWFIYILALEKSCNIP